MRLAFSNLAWTAHEDPAVLPRLAAAGFDAIEVAPTRLWDAPLDQRPSAVARVRDLVSDAGLEIIALQSLLFGKPEFQLFGDDASRRGLYEHLAGMARLAAGLGATRLVFGSPGNRRRGDLPVERADELAVELFGRLGAVAADLGVCFCIEANPVGYRCDYLTDSEASTSFVRAVDSPGVRLHLDTACMALAGDDAVERVRAGADVLAHVHASAPELGPVGPGGAVDHDVVGAALRLVDYAGYVSVEMLPPGPDHPCDTLWRTADFVRATYA